MRVLKPVLGAVLVLLVVSFITFAVQSAVPGNAAEIYVGPQPGMTAEARQQLVDQYTVELGLDKPFPARYLIWLRGAVQGDFGNNLNGVSVRSEVVTALGPSLELAAIAAFLSLPIAIVLAVSVVSQRHRGVAETMNSASLVGAIIPPFWLGLLLILVCAVWLRWLPASGYASPTEDPMGNLRTVVMPATVLTVGLVAVYYRFLQQGLREAMDSSYVTTARAKGLSERRIMYRHIVPNAVLPTLTIVGVQIGSLIGGVVIVERVFNWPGIGSLLIHSANQGSYNTVTLIVLVIAVIFVVTSLLLDIAYGLIDPRTRRS